MFPRRSILSLGIILLALPRYIINLSAISIVSTTKGKIQGFEEHVGRTRLHTYLGIPYARPPVGKLRFKRPEPVLLWKSIKPVTNLPPACIQLNDTSFKRFLGIEMWNPNTEISEDCLYLNVWAPSQDTGRPKAVMVYIYGGGFFSGSSALDLYNGKKLAASQDVIVVSMNYRVGPLGFLYNGRDDAPGNVGLLDQQLALRWVKENIVSFGGDTDRITIFGMSAGSGSVSYHLLAEGSHDLFNNAILQSGTALNDWAFMDPDEAKTMTRDIARSVGCSDEEDMDCLHQVDALSFFNHLIDHAWIRPTVDGHFLINDPKTILKNGKFKKAAVIMGVNKNEGNVFNVIKYPELLSPFKEDVSLTETEFQCMLEEAVKAHLGVNNTIINEAVKFQYTGYNSSGEDVSYVDVMDQINGDTFLRCGIIEMANYYADSGNDVYMYNLEHRTVNYPWPAWMGAIHGISVDYVFGNPPYSFTPEEKRLSGFIMAYWGNFAKTGNPNGGSLIRWPLYTTQTGGYIQLSIGDKMKTGRRLLGGQCAFWNEYVPKLKSEIGWCMTEGAACRLAVSWELLLMLYSAALSHILIT